MQYRGKSLCRPNRFLVFKNTLITPKRGQGKCERRKINSRVRKWSAAIGEQSYIEIRWLSAYHYQPFSFLLCVCVCVWKRMTSDKKLCVRVTFSEKKQERVRDKSANLIYRTPPLVQSTDDLFIIPSLCHTLRVKWILFLTYKKNIKVLLMFF